MSNLAVSVKSGIFDRKMGLAGNAYPKLSLLLPLSVINLLILAFGVFPLFLQDWQDYRAGRFLAGIGMFVLALPMTATMLVVAAWLPYRRGWSWFRWYFVAAHAVLNLAGIWMFFFIEQEVFPFWLPVTLLLSWLSVRRLEPGNVDNILLFTNGVQFFFLGSFALYSWFLMT